MASRMCSGGYSVCSSLNILHTHASQLLNINDGAFIEDELMQYAMKYTRSNGFDDNEDKDNNPGERIEDENSTWAILLRHMHYISN